MYHAKLILGNQSETVRDESNNITQVLNVL